MQFLSHTQPVQKHVHALFVDSWNYDLSNFNSYFGIWTYFSQFCCQLFNVPWYPSNDCPFNVSSAFIIDVYRQVTWKRSFNKKWQIVIKNSQRFWMWQIKSNVLWCCMNFISQRFWSLSGPNKLFRLNGMQSNVSFMLWPQEHGRFN